MAGRGLVRGGIAAALTGVVLGGACLVTGSFVRNSTVEGFARAPVGCTTTLEFDTIDTFTLYAETRGRLGDSDGGCAMSGSSFEHIGDVPDLTLTLLDETGAKVRLSDGNDFSYDTQHFTGRSYATVDIIRAGTYRLTVEADADDIVIAVGRDPERDSIIWVAAGMTIAVLGMAIGLVLVLVGLRRKPTPPAEPPVWGMTVGTEMVGYRPVGAPPPLPPAPSGPMGPGPLPPMGQPGQGPWRPTPPPPPPPGTRPSSTPIPPPPPI